MLGKKKRNKKIQAGDERRIVRKMALIVSAVLIVALVATGSLLTFYGTITNENTVGPLFEITDNSTGSPSGWNNAEEYSIVYDTSDMVPGDSISWGFGLTLSSDADANRTMYFGITDCIDDGVEVTINECGSSITNYEFVPGEVAWFVYTITTDIYTPMNSYNTTVLLTAS